MSGMRGTDGTVTTYPSGPDMVPKLFTLVVDYGKPIEPVELGYTYDMTLSAFEKDGQPNQIYGELFGRSFLVEKVEMTAKYEVQEVSMSPNPNLGKFKTGEESIVTITQKTFNDLEPYLHAKDGQLLLKATKLREQENRANAVFVKAERLERSRAIGDLKPGDICVYEGKLCTVIENYQTENLRQVGIQASDGKNYTVMAAIVVPTSDYDYFREHEKIFEAGQRALNNLTDGIFTDPTKTPYYTNSQGNRLYDNVTFKVGDVIPENASFINCTFEGEPWEPK